MIPKWLVIKNVYFNGLQYGYLMADGSWNTYGRCEDEEATKAAAAKLAEKEGVSVVQFPYSRNQVVGNVQAVTAQAVEAGKSEVELEFDSSVVAIPTLGGIIADLPLPSKDEDRFPTSVRLPVSVSAAKARTGWVVVEYQGRGVVMTAKEASERGLKEAPNWLPDISGAKSVPAPGELARLLGNPNAS